jgi:hypothetical protein
VKRTVIPIALTPMKGDEAAELDIEIQEPGIICESLLQVRPATGAIVSVRDADKQPLEMVPTIMVIIDPEAPRHKRHFIIVPPFRIIDSASDVVYRGRFLFPTGLALLLFEEVAKESSLILKEER